MNLQSFFRLKYAFRFCNNTSNKVNLSTAAKPLKKVLKMRQHVNPLKESNMVPMQLATSWVSDNFECNINNYDGYFGGVFQRRRHFIIDIGCGKGKWTFEIAKANPSCNVIGVEIRRPAVDVAIARFSNYKMEGGASACKINNLLYLHGNINVDISRLLKDITDYGANKVDIAINFPDPHFKNRNMKRRVVNEQLVEALNNLLPVDSEVFIQSDVDEVAVNFTKKFLNSRWKFQPCAGQSKEELCSNSSPYEPIRTERELNSITEGLKVYRILLKKF